MMSASCTSDGARPCVCRAHGGRGRRQRHVHTREGHHLDRDRTLHAIGRRADDCRPGRLAVDLPEQTVERRDVAVEDVSDLLSYLYADTASDTVVFSGANVYIQSGEGSTDDNCDFYDETTGTYAGSCSADRVHRPRTCRP